MNAQQTLHLVAAAAAVTLPAAAPEGLRLVLTYHCHSRSPRARRWYQAQAVLQHGSELLELGHIRGLVFSNAGNRGECLAELRRFAELNHLEVLAGVYRRAFVDLAVVGAVGYVRET